MPIRTNYQPVVRADNGKYKGAALVGVNSMILGWNVRASDRPARLMGFAVRRTDFDPTTRETLAMRWLNGMKRFADATDDLGDDVRSDQAPFQRFRWSDYTLSPSLSYRYEVFPMVGPPNTLERQEPLVFNIRPSASVVGGVGVYVNRGVTAAKAYFRRFDGRHPKDVPDGSAFRWLERGLKKSLLDFIASARAGQTLHVCIYEFFDEEIALALKSAKSRGVTVRILYHAKRGDHATHKSEDVLREAGIKRLGTARTRTGNISHNKFIILLNAAGRPRRVWTGSANFSENAFHYQTNVALTFDQPSIAAIYEDYFQILLTDPKRGRARAGQQFVQDQIEALHTRVNANPPAPINQVLYSPVRRLHVVDAAKALIASAQSAVFLSAPFGVGAELVAAINGNRNDILEYGLANSVAKRKIEGLRRRNTKFFTPTRLKRFRNEVWDAKAFGAHKVHAKTLVVDPWGPNPAVLIGSANFSEGSCKANDENTLLIQGDQRIAAIITSEFLRMYDHYKIRFWINQMQEQGSRAPMFLNSDPSWSDIYFRTSSRSRKFRDREVFSGMV